MRSQFSLGASADIAPATGRVGSSCKDTACSQNMLAAMWRILEQDLAWHGAGAGCMQDWAFFNAMRAGSLRTACGASRAPPPATCGTIAPERRPLSLSGRCLRVYRTWFVLRSRPGGYLDAGCSRISIACAAHRWRGWQTPLSAAHLAHAPRFSAVRAPLTRCAAAFRRYTRACRLRLLTLRYCGLVRIAAPPAAWHCAPLRSIAYISRVFLCSSASRMYYIGYRRSARRAISFACSRLLLLCIAAAYARCLHCWLQECAARKQNARTLDRGGSDVYHLRSGASFTRSFSSRLRTATGGRAHYAPPRLHCALTWRLLSLHGVGALSRRGVSGSHLSPLCWSAWINGFYRRVSFLRDSGVRLSFSARDNNA